MTKDEIWNDIWSIIYEGKMDDDDTVKTLERIKAYLYNIGYDLIKIKD